LGLAPLPPQKKNKLLKNEKQIGRYHPGEYWTERKNAV